jgi:hypothetical protein
VVRLQTDDRISRLAARWVAAAALGALAFTSACASDPAAALDASTTADVPPKADTGPPVPKWHHETVDRGAIGRHLRLAVVDDAPAVAYFATTGVEGEACDEVGDSPPNKIRWSVFYAAPGADGWEVETASEILYVGQPVGLDLKTAPDGTPTLAAMTGEPVVNLKYCGANDVGLLSRTAPGQWALDTLVATSGEAATGQAASDYGDVVGYWPSVAWDAAGTAAVAYKDVHAGSIQSDDLGRADLEVVWGSQHVAVDIGKGAGNYNTLAFDSVGRPLILYHTPTDDFTASQHGLWLARSDDGGATWPSVKLNAGKNTERPSLVVKGDEVWVAYYKVSDGLPWIARLIDPNQLESLDGGWQQERFGDPLYDEGTHPSLAIAPDGRVAVAYYRCTRATNGLGNCSPNDDAVVFAWFEDGEWEVEVVDEGEQGLCGLTPSLAFLADGTAVIAYQCSTQGTDGFQFEVRVATREPLP